MKFHVRIIQFVILLELNKYSFYQTLDILCFRNSLIVLVKFKTEFLQWLKEYITV